MPDGRTITLNQGDRFETNSACEMLTFINNLPADQTYAEGRANIVGELNEEARQEGCVSDTASANPDAGTTSPGTDAAPPPDGDTPGAQGAPQIQDPDTVNAPTGDPNSQVPGQNPDPPPQPQPGEEHRTHGGEQAQRQAQGGDPVDLFTGQFYLEETDLLIPSTLLPLAMVRRYRSGPPNFGPFGWNWDHNHNVYLRELTSGDVARWSGALHEDVFAQTGGGFEPPRGVFEQLTQLPGLGQIYEITSSGGVVWHFERPAGWTDAERIPLAFVRDRHGNLLRYAYDTDNRVAAVRDDDGHFFQFHYGDCGLLEALEDHAGRRIIYEHEPDVEHLAAVHFPATADHPDGIKRAYYYEHPGALPELRHNIVRVEDGDGITFVENEYEDDPSQWCYSRLKAQSTGGYLYQFKYTQLQYVPPDELFVNIPAVQVEVLAPDFALATHTFNYRGDLLDYRQRLSKDGSFRVVAWAYRYDSQGNLAEQTRPDGSQELRVYDDANPDPRARHNLLRRELTAAAGFPAPSRIVWRGQYDPNFQLLRQELTEDGSVTRYRYDFDTAPGPGNTGVLREIVHATATLPDGTQQNSVTRFETNARGQVTAIISADGVRQEMEYGAGGTEQGRLVLVRRDAGGLNIEERLAYDAVGYQSSITDGVGSVHGSVYNALGQVERRITPAVAGAVSEARLHYDSSGQVVALEMPRGAYDDAVLAGRPLLHSFTRNAQGFVEHYSYAANTLHPRIAEQTPDYRGNAVETRHSDGSVEKVVYDERGLILLEETLGDDGTQGRIRRVYDRSGRMVRRIEESAGGLVTEYRHDAFGRMSQIDLPNGSTVAYTWGDNDVLAGEAITGDPGDGSRRLLSERRYVYDERARLVRSIEHTFRDNPAAAIDLVTEYTYNVVNLLDRVVDPRGGETRYQHDTLGRLVRITDPEGNEQHYAYDAVGRVVSVEFRDVEPGGVVSRTWQSVYDERGRAVRKIDPVGNVTTIDYDDRDLPVRNLDPGGVVRERAFGPLGELLSEALDPGGLSLVNAWTYDSRGRLLAYTDPAGETTRYFHDGIGRPVGVEMPNSGLLTRVYGANGRLASESHAGGAQFQYTYDPAGRLAGLQGTGAPGTLALAPHQYRYDGLDRLVEATVGGLSVTRKWDSAGRLVAETSHGATLEMHYNDAAATGERRWPDGRREEIDYNLNGIGVRVRRTAAGSLGSGGAQLGSFSPSGAAYFGEAQLQGALSVTAGYDEGKRLIALTYRDGGALREQVVYRYDARWQRRIEQQAVNPAQMRYHDYDARGRLTLVGEGLNSALGAGQTQTDHDTAIAAAQAAAGGAVRRLEYQYDPADGRVLYRETGQPDRIYTYTAGHRMITAGAEAFTYGANGSRASDGTRTYQLDALGRVVEVRVGALVAARITYDALGRPAVVEENGQPARSLSYLGDQVLHESQGGATVRQFTPHPMMASPLAVHTAGSTAYTVFDGRMNLMALVDTSGQALERYRYDPFGRPAIFDPSGTPLAGSAFDMEPLFGGMRYLPAAGLYMAQRRLMDPEHGVFLMPEPFTYLGSPSLYVYAAQDPLNLVDPLGDIAFLAVLGVIAVGALIGAGLNAARQGIQIAEGSRDEFSWSELGWSTLIGGAAAPLLVFAPELAIPLAGYGVGSGINEIRQGHIATGAFDIGTAILPFSSSKVRGSVFNAPRTLSGRLAPFRPGTLPTAEPAPGSNRVTHVTSEEALTAIRNGNPAEGVPPNQLRSTTPRSAAERVLDGPEEGPWVAPTRAAELSPWRRAMTGLPGRRPYVEFDVQPGELARPTGLAKRFFSRYQQRVTPPLDSSGKPAPFLDLSGRNPVYGELPGIEPLLFTPTLRFNPFDSSDPSQQHPQPDGDGNAAGRQGGQGGGPPAATTATVPQAGPDRGGTPTGPGASGGKK